MYCIWIFLYSFLIFFSLLKNACFVITYFWLALFFFFKPCPPYYVSHTNNRASILWNLTSSAELVFSASFPYIWVFLPTTTYLKRINAERYYLASAKKRSVIDEHFSHFSRILLRLFAVNYTYIFFFCYLCTHIWTTRRGQFSVYNNFVSGCTWKTDYCFEIDVDGTSYLFAFTHFERSLFFISTILLLL